MMRKSLAYVFLCSLLVLTFSPAVFADSSPSRVCVIPEAIWAPATGGGTWVTALQVTAKTSLAFISIQFFYGSTATEYRTVHLADSTSAHQTFRWSNILQSMAAIDNTFDYYGRVGALLVYTLSDLDPIWASAMTTNGNFGKTLPSFAWANTENTAAVGREMVIPGMMKSAAYRTFAGFFNSGAAMTVRFSVVGDTFAFIGSSFEKTIPSYGFISFNPFAEAGITGNYTNTWLYIVPLSGGDAQGLFCFGSIANNITNDTYALIAIPFL